MSDAAALKPKSVADISAVLPPAVMQRARAAAQTTVSNEIASNPVYQIMLDEALSPEAKRDAIAAFLTVAASKEENRAHIAAYQAFEEYRPAPPTKAPVRDTPATVWANRRKGRLAFMHLFAATQITPQSQPSLWQLVPRAYRALIWLAGFALIGVAGWLAVMRAIALAIRYAAG